MFAPTKFRDEWMHALWLCSAGRRLVRRVLVVAMLASLPPVHAFSPVHSFPPFTHSPPATPSGIEAIPVGLRGPDDAEREMGSPLLRNRWHVWRVACGAQDGEDPLCCWTEATGPPVGR